MTLYSINFYPGSSLSFLFFFFFYFFFFLLLLLDSSRDSRVGSSERLLRDLREQRTPLPDRVEKAFLTSILRHGDCRVA